MMVETPTAIHGMFTNWWISQPVSVLDWWSMDSAFENGVYSKENDGTLSCNISSLLLVRFLFLFFLVAFFFQRNPQHWTYDISPAESSPLKAICAMALGSSRTVEAEKFWLQRCHKGEIVDDGCLGGVIHSRTTTTLFGWSFCTQQNHPEFVETLDMKHVDCNGTAPMC